MPNLELPPIIDQKSILLNNDYEVYDILFNKDYSFILNTNTGQISGTFDVISNSEIKLIKLGTISNINVNNNQIEFRISISGKFRFDVTGQRDQNFQEGKIYIPDTNFELALIDLGYDNVPDNYLDSNNVTEIIELDLSNKQINDLTGLENFTSLVDLNLSGNLLTRVPIVNFKNLTTLNLSDNLFSVLDISFNEKLNSLNASNNSDLTCIKVGPSLYNNLPAGYVADQASFELECNCPTLTLTSGFNSKTQTLCSGEPMNTVTYQLGGENISAFILDSNSLPLGVSSSIDNNSITISGTPFFDGSQEIYNIVINTSNSNNNCSQVSQTVVINKNIDSPILTLDSGSPLQVAGSLLNLNQVSQSVCVGTPIVPIVYSFSGASNGVNISGLPSGVKADVSNGLVTISGTHDQIGIYNYIVTTRGSNQCSELNAQGSLDYKTCN